MEYLIGLVIALLGTLFYSNTKRKSAEALLQNTETKEKLLEKDADSLKAKAHLEVEEKLRADVAEELKRKTGNEPSIKDVEDFFNNPSGNKP